MQDSSVEQTEGPCQGKIEPVIDPVTIRARRHAVTLRGGYIATRHMRWHIAQRWHEELPIEEQRGFDTLPEAEDWVSAQIERNAEMGYPVYEKRGYFTWLIYRARACRAAINRLFGGVK
jgi:hypothetical protein